MTGAKEKLAIVAGTAALVSGSLWMLEPHVTQPPQNSEQVQRDKTDRDTGDLSDSNDTVNDRHRDSGTDLGDAERKQKLIPGEHRPPEPHLPKFKVFPR